MRTWLRGKPGGAVALLTITALVARACRPQ
jgi:hypothetical protein